MMGHELKGTQGPGLQQTNIRIKYDLPKKHFVGTNLV